jgi:hypothetical protein
MNRHDFSYDPPSIFNLQLFTIHSTYIYVNMIFTFLYFRSSFLFNISYLIQFDFGLKL